MTERYDLQLDHDGKPVMIRDGEMKQFDFNAIYKGYFPSCRWTSAGRGKLLCLAGTDREGRPHLFSSAGGEVWTETNIRTRLGLPDPRDYGDIIRILFEEGSGQIFLVSNRGYLVTLPDCPQCVRARKVSDRILVDGMIEEDSIILTEESGAQIRIQIGSALEYRCAWDFAKPFMKKGGLLMDLRDREEQQQFPVPAAIRLDIGDLDGLLLRMPKKRPLFFFCGHGYLADQAVREAREAGFEFAWSLGGVSDLMKDQEGA